MDHTEALRLQAAEKYVLGELTPALRDEYEEHYFDCQECAADLRSAVAFAGVTRAAFQSGQSDFSEDEAPRGWFAWLRPAVLVPAMGVLVAALAYQSFVAIPRLQHFATSSPAGSASFVSLIGADSRSNAAKSFVIQQNQPVILEVDIPPSPFSSFLCQIQDAAGHSVYDGSVSVADARQSVHLIVPGGALRPGTYSLRVLGQKAGDGEAASDPEVAKFQFTVVFRP